MLSEQVSSMQQVVYGREQRRAERGGREEKKEQRGEGRKEGVDRRKMGGKEKQMENTHIQMTAGQRCRG